MDPIVVIPARLASTRLPDKPLADIAGVPMIVQVWRRGIEAKVGPVVVACADERIAEVVREAGGEAVMTDPDHASGSDRIYEAVGLADPEGHHDVVINLQGDLPTIDPAAVRAVLDPLADAAVDIATLAVATDDPAERADPNVVKAVAPFASEGGVPNIARALYFSRAPIPAGAGPIYHHVGIYAYRRQALERFVRLPVGVLEAREKLEQLRALEAGMRIDAALIDTVPLGVDTPEDLEIVRASLK